ncbi:MAG TPA: hypothetical protein VLF43_03110 [Candidatus Saccharimonadales bacterium]|nr:hypothetical protein [Candidatus Saccharimonadales bacterium]
MKTVLDTESIHLRVDGLGPNSTVFHAWLHPGVSPSDRDSHADMLAGRSMDFSSPYFQGIADGVKQGVDIRQLRVLPEAGQFGYNADDIAVMRQQAAEISRVTNAPIRTVDFNFFTALLSRAQGVNPKLVRRYLKGVENDNPQSSFWSIRTLRSTGKVALEYLGLIDYIDGVCPGRRIVEQPIPPGIQAYEQFCQSVYHAYGDEVVPVK